MARETDVIPDLYFPDDDDGVQSPINEGTGDHRQEEVLGDGDIVDPTKEDFIPIHQLTLEDLPESIRTNENLQLILDFSKRVVRVNNNGLSDKRPDDDEFKMKKQRTLTGSGYIWSCRDNSVNIITNRHVLFNAEELEKSTFDIFFDYNHGDCNDKEKLFKRCVRKDGKMFFGKCSKYDLVMAVYMPKETMMSHIKEHWPGHAEMPRQWKLTQRQISAEAATMVPTVCLISHPEGQPKQVSFGEVVNYDVHKKILHHSAPSQPGSSGAPLIVFSNRDASYSNVVYIYHVGTRKKTGRKIANVDDVDLSFLDREDSMNLILNQISANEHERTESDDMARKARTSLDVIAMAAFVPAFGAFHLQFEKTRLVDLDTSLVQPCMDFQRNDISAAILRHPSVKEISCNIARIVPCFALCLSSNPNDVSDLVSLLESQGQCFCRSIVKMMESGVKSEDGAVTEFFLSPYRAAAKMSTDSDVTWPWLNRSKPDSCGNESEEEGCLLMKCLKLCALTIPVTLLHMIVKANASIRNLLPHLCEASSTTSGKDDSGWQMLYCRDRRTPPCEQSREGRPDDARAAATPRREGRLESQVPGSDEDWLLLAKDVLVFVEEALRLNLFNFQARHFSHGELSQQEEGSSELSMLFARCLAQSDHMMQHERQVHPDMEILGQGDSSGEKCQCGRPDILVALEALFYLKGCVGHVPVGGDSENFAPIEEITTDSQEDMDLVYATFFMLFLREMEKSGLRGSDILVRFEEVGHFPRGRHSVLLYLASIETFLYNCHLLSKSINQHQQLFYCEWPTSMFGRPGNWPGNIMPPEVRRTAWMLIDDAITASGLPPTVLADLEEERERREKLVDVYVDMKQLKWKGRVQPEEFAVWLSSCQSRRISSLEQYTSFPSATSYFVVAVYFILLPQIFVF